MELPTYFADFLKEIRPTKDQRDDLKRGHRTLRQRLEQDETLASIIISTFLQGSYRRATAVRPKSGKRSDVDIIVVAKLSKEEYNPEEALQLFVPFLNGYYKDKYEIQGRSIGITLTYVDLDLVVTSAPSESEIGLLQSASVTTENTPEDVDDWRLVKSWIPLEERAAWNARFLLEAATKEAEWKLSPLYIPDREAECWEPTHPLEQIRWTWEKNRQCNGHYVNVVKAIKWWRRVNHSEPKYPKGYPVEHLIGQCCPDGITSVAEGVTKTLETIAEKYKDEASQKEAPELKDHGVEHNVFARVSGEDFATFHSQVCEAAEIARRAFDANEITESVDAWQELFGSKFPAAPSNEKTEQQNHQIKGGYTPREDVSIIGGGRFA